VAMASSDRVISDLIQTGQAFVQLPTPYGRQNCQGQGVIEVSESSFGESAGLFVSSTWDQGQTIAPCESRRSQFSVWVKLDNGSSDAGQDGWTHYDRVSVAGVVPASLPDKCMAQPQCRIKSLPESMSTLCDSPNSYVDLKRKSGLGRVTSVKVVAEASANCEALPLEFLVSLNAE
jgi:hypothetical protein